MTANIFSFTLPNSLAEAKALDQQDPLTHQRAHFILEPGLIYLDGNSLGPLSRPAQEATEKALHQEWGQGLISSWVDADWINLPARVGARIAPLIGARAEDVVCADSVSVNIFKLAEAALALQPGRRKIVTEEGNFPTDIYILQGLSEITGRDIDLCVVPRTQVDDAIDDQTALVLLTHSHYVTAELFDMAAMTKLAHQHGALILWDLSHSTGVLDIDLNGIGADFATGCGYKYLNGGPGAPAYAFVHQRYADKLTTPLAGWMGHKAPFDFSGDYAPATGVQRLQVGTPYILSMSALFGALSLFDTINMADIVHKSRALSSLFMHRMSTLADDLTLLSPTQAELRGGHIAYRHPHAYAIVQALIAQNIIGDYREPQAMRFAPAPLYTSFEDIWRATEILGDILLNRKYLAPEFQNRRYVP